MLIHQWEYVKVGISRWKYSYLVKRNLVKAHCKRFGMVYFLFITPLSEELLFFKKASKKLNGFLVCFNKMIYFYWHDFFVLQDFTNSLIFSPSKPGYISKCQNFLWNRNSSPATALSVETLEWGMMVNLCNYPNKPKLARENKSKKKKKREREVTYADFCNERVLSNSSMHAIVPVTELVLLVYRSFLAISLDLPSDTVAWRRHQWYGTSHSSRHFFQQTGVRRWTLFKPVAKIITHETVESECNHLGPFEATFALLDWTISTAYYCHT